MKRVGSIPRTRSATSLNSASPVEAPTPSQQPGPVHQATPAQQRASQQRPDQASAPEGSDGEGYHQQPFSTLTSQGSRGLPGQRTAAAGHTR